MRPTWTDRVRWPLGPIVALGLLMGGMWMEPAMRASARAAPTASIPDASFGSGGIASLSLGYRSASAAALAVQPDGRIVAAGSAVPAPYIETLGYVVLGRMLPDGAPDASFGTGGTAVIAFEDRVSGAVAVALQPDRRIVTAGTVATTGPIDGDGAARIIEQTMDVVVTRSLPDGSPDPTFGSVGRVVADYGGQDIAIDVAILPDGAIVVLGRSTLLSRMNRQVFVARFREDGTPDAGFGVGGSTTIDFGRAEHPARALAVQPDGKLLILGAGVRAEANAQQDLALARLLPDGGLDPSFGEGGIVMTDVERLFDRPGGLVLQTDGKIVVAGSGRRMKPNGSDAEIVLLRYHADGSIDPAFGDGGMGVADLGRDDWATGLVQRPNGQLVTRSRLTYGVLVGFTADGALDPTFGQGGILRSAGEHYGALAVQPDGKLLVSVVTEGMPPGFVIQRPLAN